MNFENFVFIYLVIWKFVALSSWCKVNNSYFRKFSPDDVVLGLAPESIMDLADSYKDFSIAYQEAQKIPGCVVHIGARPNEIHHENFVDLDSYEDKKLAMVIADEQTKILAYVLKQVSKGKPENWLQIENGQRKNKVPKVVVGVFGLYHAHGVLENIKKVKKEAYLEAHRKTMPQPTKGYIRGFINSLFESKPAPKED